MRDRFNAWVAKHDIAWELGMGFLAIVFVAVGFAIDQAGPDVLPRLEAIELGLTAVFVAEFALRFGAARDRAQYLRGHWIDLLALAPPLRGARSLRLLRLLRLVRAFAGIYRAALHVERVVRYRGFAALVVAWLSVMVVTSIAMYVAERDFNAAINSPLDALWWGVTTLTTVGYGDVIPVTPEGRIAAAILMLLGITLFSAITATVTSFMLETRREIALNPATAFTDELERLARLREDGALTDDEFGMAKARILG